MNKVRLNKFLSDAGICSRREADRAVEAGEVTVNGEPAVMGQKIAETDEVCFRGRPVRRKAADDFVLLAVNKREGIVCTTSRKDPDNIVDYVGYPTRIYPVGRLDKDSEGLILMTDRGELSDRILRSVNGHEKEYQVRVDKPVTKEFIDAMKKGVRLEDVSSGAKHFKSIRTKPCFAEKTGSQTFRIILTQGLNRQIRRMCEALGYRVTHLKRVRVMNIELRDLKVGEYRHVRGEELETLLAMLDEKDTRNG